MAKFVFDLEYFPRKVDDVVKLKEPRFTPTLNTNKYEKE